MGKAKSGGERERVGGLRPGTSLREGRSWISGRGKRNTVYRRKKTD